jgi:hypothetical protein
VPSYPDAGAGSIPRHVSTELLRRALIFVGVRPGSGGQSGFLKDVAVPCQQGAPGRAISEADAFIKALQDSHGDIG